MINLVTLKDTFLEDAEVLILGTRDNDELKKHLDADYNIGDSDIKGSVKSFEKARDADMAYRKVVPDSLEAEENFRELFYEAYDMVEEHTDFLKIALKDDYNKAVILFFINYSPSMDITEWLANAIELYCLAIPNCVWVERMSKRKITKDSMFKGLKTVFEAQAAFEKLIPETEKGKKAFEKRIDALRELSDAFVELQTASYHVLGKHPELLKKPSVSNLSTIVFAKMVKDSSITRKVKMVKDSSITRKILDAINKIFSQTIKKFFDPGRNWEK